jgi:cysteine desulfurase/selenocysteine lyase
VNNLSQFAKIRGDFPALSQKIRGKSWIYLDSAATSLKPWPVIERISLFNSYQSANVHRGSFYLADQATQYFEETRLRVQKFLGAEFSEEIIFTKGTTESINLVANSLARSLNPGDEILLTEMEHHANIVPWQIVAEARGASIKVVTINDDGTLNEDSFKALLSKKTKIVAVTHCSNVLGTYNDLTSLIAKAHEVGALVLVDGAQAVANFKVNVLKLDADFYVFSAHKIFGPFGTGVLYGKKALLEKMPPYQGGGSMISEVTFAKTTYNILPYKFEAGTPNIEGVIALGAAIQYLEEKLQIERVEEFESSLFAYAMDKMSTIEGIHIYGRAQKRAPILSFNIGKIHHSDVAQILDQENISVRAGHLCAQPLLKKLGVSGCVRASFSVFNNQLDVDTLVKATMKAKEMLS